MKRGKIYFGILLGVLVIAQFIQMYVGAKVLMFEQISKTTPEHQAFSWLDTLFFSPFFGPLCLLVLFLFIRGIDKLGNLISSMIKRPKWLIIGIIFSLFIIWDTFRLSQIHYNSLFINQLDWPIWLTAQIIVSLLFIPGYFLFFYFKKRYFHKMDFADAEVLKFGYIFILWSIFNLLHSYLESQIWMYLEPHSDRYYVWRSPQIPAFALMLATANFLNNFRKHYFQLKSKNQSFGRMQKNQLESEAALAALHARVNPHFLYNALNSIASLAKEDAEKTEKMALALSTFYKYNTNRNEEHWATIAEELNILANYLTIEQIRFDEQLIINYEIEEGIKKYLIPKFMLQPLVENGIKYGFDEKSNKIIVTIKIIKQQGQLLICIFDKGLPFSDTLQLGYGLRSVQKKLKLFYPDQHSLTLVNEPEKGIMITLPMLRDTKK